MKQNISQRKFVTLWNCNGGCSVGDISEYHRLSGFSSRGYAHVGGMCDSPWGSFFLYEMFAGQGVTLQEDIYRFCGRHRSMFLFHSQLGVAYMTSQMLMAGLFIFPQDTLQQEVNILNCLVMGLYFHPVHASGVLHPALLT
jgi:hypothetical protein